MGIGRLAVIIMGLMVAAAAAHGQGASPHSNIREQTTAARGLDGQAAELPQHGAVAVGGRGLATSELGLHLQSWEVHTRARLDEVTSAIPRIPGEMANAYRRLLREIASSGDSTATSWFLALLFIGVVAEIGFQKWWLRQAEGLEEFLPIVMFGAYAAILFFALDCPPVTRAVTACLLLALVTYRVVALSIGMTSNRRLHAPLSFMAGVACAMGATTVSLEILTVDNRVVAAVSHLFASALLVVSILTISLRTRKSQAVRIALSAFLIWVWIIWSLGFSTMFWLSVYAFLLPAVLRSAGHVVRDRVCSRAKTSDNWAIFLVRGSRALVIGLATAWIAFVWRTDEDPIFQNAIVGELFSGFLKSIAFVLLGDLVWHLGNAAMDRHLLLASINSDTNIDPEAKATRLETMLPILRNVLGITLFVLVALLVLGQLGVDIAPLIAGAGIFGVAIGFGSQALVRDVISGVFYLLDDAFRVGEYIQAKTYSGTVESFSLRSIRLRHHRGPIFTVPFGELGAVENMSRDWSKLKVRISVPFTTDLEKVRRIGKLVGQRLQDDPEVGALFIQPLKMKGIEDIGEYGILVSFAMVTTPTSQASFIRRKALTMLRDAFRENGISFAQPMVNVAGENTSTEASAAAVAFHRKSVVGEAAGI